MTSSNDFDFFLKNGFIEGLSEGSSMNILLTKYGNDNWYVKEIENNGLIYGIIKIGFIEFHIYNEQISGISYRPDLPFDKKDFKNIQIPWIYKVVDISDIENNLTTKKIEYKKYIVNGPKNTFRTAGADLLITDGGHTFIDTEGGVTFLFDTNEKTRRLEVYQICKYYDIHKQKEI
ncbi:MAG: hypothetical protein J0I84_23700 [Terrimonas sp.]|nr:hypothetical protein [Terrimonas sp.]OJY92125.1 MAG: hypothetical protein BGP13_08130 [Sphingobacteriales bacterium 40-81]